MAASPSTNPRRRLGNWLPDDEARLAAFRRTLAARAREQAGRAPMAGAVQALADHLQSNAICRMQLTRAIDDARAASYELGYTNIDELMRLVNYLMTFAPPFSDSSLVICPLNALLDWPMCMPGGHALLRDATVNARLRDVLATWAGFLDGPYSRIHLKETSPDGWFCPEAVAKMDTLAFRCDPAQPFWGFDSWNDFFTRRFRAGERPVAKPADDKCIVSACEASPYGVRDDVRLSDRFWIKSQPYSLIDVFTPGYRALAQRFAGGTIYQAFLSAYNYHRWHAPVSGRVVHAYRVSGTYYSAAESEGVDQGSLNDSQGYITATATRAIIVIDCDDEAIGQVGCVFVGMAEVSSCVIDVLPGQHVAKGDEIGYFQYGGSTYCLAFEPGVIRTFVPQPPYSASSAVRVNASLATAN